MQKNIFLAVLFLLLSACGTDAHKPKAQQAPDAQSAPQTDSETQKMCFMLALNNDTTTVNLLIEGDKVTGNMQWLPYEKDGATGTLNGIKQTNGELDLLYDYMIEGTQQTETKMMKIEGNNLYIKQGELIDPNNDGHLKYKDHTKAQYTEVLPKVPCR